MFHRVGLTTCLVLLACAAATRGENSPAIVPKADEVLRRMSAYLASKPQFGFTVHDMLDHVAPDGQRISLGKQSKVKVRRPNRIAADVVGDVVLSDPYKAMTSNVRSGKYVGLHRVRGIPAHHLAFRQEMVDWQIWIMDGDSPLPLKVVITYKEQPGDPQYIALYDNWDMTAQYDDATFEVVLPPNAKKFDLKAPEKEAGQ